ncbi:MAG TPA: PadR family transcriptional regulator [Vicinamibacterales bacterium]|jgi:transcriptional regulator|nr:PadR family transcriptional regulator [Vicinamibacterales bacterium]
MPRDTGIPRGTLMMVVLRVLKSEPLHGYAIAQRIRVLSNEQLSVEEGSLYPALQKLLINGWVKAAWRESESGRRVRAYGITARGRRQLEAEVAEYRRMADAIGLLLDEA